MESVDGAAAGGEPRSSGGAARRAEQHAGVVGAPLGGGAASSVEVYGFVGWITSAVAFGAQTCQRCGACSRS